MFDGIKKLPLKPAQENLDQTTTLSGEPAPAAPTPPPSRFGAVKIPMEQDPDQSIIKILEVPNESNTNDYFVIINGGIRGCGTYYAEFMTLLETLTEQSTVVITLSSPGGSLYTGAMIASGLRNTKAQVVTIANGIVASAAALIWSYGKVRKVKPNAVILFHMSSHMDWGNSEKIRITAENTVRYVKEICIDPMVEQGLITLDEAETIIDKRRDVLIDAATMNARLEKLYEQTP